MEQDITWETKSVAQQVEAWRSDLDAIQARLSNTNDVLQIHKIRDTELPILSEEFAYAGEVVYLMGRAIVPEINGEGSVVGQRWVEDTETLGLHCGFSIQRLSVNGVSSAVEHRIAHKIYIAGGDEKTEFDVIERQFQVFTKHDCQNSVFLPLDEIDPLFHVFDDETIETSPIESRID